MGRSSRFVQRHGRVPLQVKAHVTTLDAVRDAQTGEAYFRFSEETCANLSEGGAFVATHQPLREGSRVMLELELPDGQRVETIGSVVWSRTELVLPGSARKADLSGMGIEFTHAAPDQAAALEKYLAQALPRTRARSGRIAAQPSTP